MRIATRSLFLAAMVGAGIAQERSQPRGLAWKYPGDAGIEKDPNVILVESFETESWRKTWQEISHPRYKKVETRPKLVYAGKRSLRLDITAEAGKSGAGWMSHWWDGSDEVYLRYYFRLSKGGDWRNNKLLQLHGRQRGVRYGPGAGIRPTGFDSVCSGTGVGGQEGPPWTGIILYTYWPHQKGNYGDNVRPNKGIQPKVNEEEWTCFEVMIRLNDVGKHTGEQRLWINGRLVIEQTGMEWRKTNKLVINNIMLSTYTHAPPKPGTKRAVWIDDIVLAKRYIGPRRAMEEK